MLQIDALRPDTKKLYLDLRALGGLEQFVLIGGTAMALHHAHRESEDLDFVYVPAQEGSDRSNLPLGLTQSLIAQLLNRGHAVHSLLADDDMETAENEGFYLPNAHQDWSVDGVKLTLFAGDTADRRRPFHTLPTVDDDGVRILTSDAIFETKSRLIVQRATTRDLFDLWYFVDRLGKSLEEVVAFALEERPHYTEDHILRRLQPRKQAVEDPGFKPVANGAPRDFYELVEALEAHVDLYQQRVALSILEQEESGPSFG